MAGFTTYADLLSEFNAGKVDEFNFMKNFNTTPDANSWASAWKLTGYPGAGADPATTPGTSYSADQSTVVAGSMWFPDRSTDQRHLFSFGAASSFTTLGGTTIMLYDRLVGVSGILTTTTGAKTINSTALPRYSGTAATLNEAWLEVTTAPATTAPIVHMSSYTSADGTAGITTAGQVTFPSTAAPAGAFIQLPVDASKQGIRSVETLNVDTASVTTGTVNVIILRPLLRIIIPGLEALEVSTFDDIMSPVQIFDNAVLAFAYLPSSVNSPGFINGRLRTVYG